MELNPIDSEFSAYTLIDSISTKDYDVSFGGVRIPVRVKRGKGSWHNYILSAQVGLNDSGELFQINYYDWLKICYDFKVTDCRSGETYDLYDDDDCDDIELMPFGFWQSIMNHFIPKFGPSDCDARRESKM